MSVTVGTGVRQAWVAENVGTLQIGRDNPVRCAYCDFVGHLYLFDRPVGWCVPVKLEWDHIHPLELGGTNTADNLTLACRPCNRSKGHKTMAQWLCART